MMPGADHLALVVDTLRGSTFRNIGPGGEMALQQEIADALAAHGLDFSREHRIDGRSRIDFLVEGGVGLEVKVDGSGLAIHRQLRRYAQAPEIRALVLATGRRRPMPPEIDGKPVKSVWLGRRWL